jgi:uncharacterized protein with FMN-binding domain
LSKEVKKLGLGCFKPRDTLSIVHEIYGASRARKNDRGKDKQGRFIMASHSQDLPILNILGLIQYNRFIALKLMVLKRQNRFTASKLSDIRRQNRFIA